MNGLMQKTTTTTQVTQKRGRPTKYQSGIDILAEAYLDGCRDIFEAITRKWHVHLPTIGGFALYLGVHKSTLYNLAKNYQDYTFALERIMNNQYGRLINGGLSRRYKATLVVLMLKRNHWKRLTIWNSL